MRPLHTFTIVALSAVVGWLTLPAFAEPPAGPMSEQGMQMNDMRGQGGHHGMMSGAVMQRCAGMMQSMNGDAGPPNSQWQKPTTGIVTPP